MATALDPTLGRMLNDFFSLEIYKWQPRPDDGQFDEQMSFVNSQHKFSIALGGTGAGKTAAAAYKTARYVLDTPAPRKDTPFWIVGETFEMVCAVCWEEKLRNFIPESAIHSVDWYKASRNWPNAVILHDLHKTGTNWVLEFKSYMQGRSRMQARSIGGYWFNEEVPFRIVEEVQGRCRDYDSPGWADFTPIEIRDHEWPDAYDDPPEGWEFFHLDTSKNTALAEGWFERWIQTIPADMRDTRQYGVFATFSGQVFKEWNRKIHVIEPFDLPDDWKRYRGIDFGYNDPFVCLWVAKDNDGRYYVYDEHYMQRELLETHAREIKRRWWSRHPICGATYADHDSQDRAQLDEYGVHTSPAKKDDLNGGIELVRRHLVVQGDGKPKLYVFNNCVNLIREMRNYRWSPAVGEGTDRERNPLNVPWDFDNHCIDALRYVIASLHWQNFAIAKPLAKQQREWQNEVSGRFLL